MKNLLFVLVLLLPIVADAQDPLVEIDGINYSLSVAKKTASVVTKKYSEYSGEIKIPETVTYDNSEYSVTSIGCGAFFECGELSSVSIPNSVVSIDYCAFGGCKKLVSVTNSNNLKRIEQSAFDGCSGLLSIVIPNSVTNIEALAFFTCF